MCGTNITGPFTAITPARNEAHARINHAAFLAFVKGRKLYKKKEIPLIFTGV